MLTPARSPPADTLLMEAGTSKAGVSVRVALTTTCCGAAAERGAPAGRADGAAAEPGGGASAVPAGGMSAACKGKASRLLHSRPMAWAMGKGVYFMFLTIGGAALGHEPV